MQQRKALMLGAVIGFLMAAFPACSSGTTHRCTASNCDGCCDELGVCQLGDKLEQCGSSGASCAVCQGATSCQRVSSSNPYGGECKSTTSGTGGGSGGGRTDGGSNTGGGNTTGCNATTCPNGCCTATGSCITVTTPSRCGTAGAACQQCNTGNSCKAGACTPCAGCIDPATGACVDGNMNTACGKGGGLCSGCDTANGVQCMNNVCVGANGGCGTCDGCCDGTTCRPRSTYSNSFCGQGSSGGACVACQGISQCDLDAGACVGDMGTGGGTGFPGFDGGALDVCSLACAGKCCEIFFVIPQCSDPGKTCKINKLATCDGASLTCK